LRYELPNLHKPRLPFGFAFKALKDYLWKTDSCWEDSLEFLEPLSVLQKIAGCLEHIELILKAALADNCHQRLLYIAAFAVSLLSGLYGQIAVPFRGLLGETYQI
jgi:hypothetical protein